MIDNQAVNSYPVPAPQVNGKEVITVENLVPADELSFIQKSFAENWGLKEWQSPM